jgi:outer membrane protein assembly factor BamB
MIACATFRKRPEESAVWLLVVSFAFASAGSDWPQFRGLNHDAISPDRITANWTGTVTNPIWRILLPNALCSLVVSEGKVYTQAKRTIDGARREVCVALSATNGTELWATALDDAYYPDGGVGV